MPLTDIEAGFPDTIRLQPGTKRPDCLKVIIDHFQAEGTNQHYPKKHVIGCFRMSVKSDETTKYVELTALKLCRKLISSGESDEEEP